MQSKVRFSTFSIVTTIILTCFIIGVCVFAAVGYDLSVFFFMLSITFLVLISALSFAPFKLIADPKTITVKSILWNHHIPVSEIKDVVLFRPKMTLFRNGTRRTYASGGYFGYWGQFYDRNIGRFTGYYGDSSQCFLLNMRNGKKYVLGCEQPLKMAEYINKYVK